MLLVTKYSIPRAEAHGPGAALGLDREVRARRLAVVELRVAVAEPAQQVRLKAIPDHRIAQPQVRDRRVDGVLADVAGAAQVQIDLVAVEGDLEPEVAAEVEPPGHAEVLAEDPADGVVGGLRLEAGDQLGVEDDGAAGADADVEPRGHVLARLGHGRGVSARDRTSASRR